MVWQFFDIPVPCPFAVVCVWSMMFPKCSKQEHFCTQRTKRSIDYQQLTIKNSLKIVNPKSWEHFGTFLDAGLNEKRNAQYDFVTFNKTKELMYECSTRPS